MRILAMGDPHGRFKALKNVLNKCSFDYSKDKLICLGDICDGGRNTKKCVSELLKIKNLIFIIGNHDFWFIRHMNSGWKKELWLSQGGCATLTSYGAKCTEGKNYFNNKRTTYSKVDTTNLNIPVTHQDFFNRGVEYYIENDMCFVHGGFRPGIPMCRQDKETLMWDRDLIRYAQTRMVPGFKKVFVGHTTTQRYGMIQPIKYHNLYMLDCSGKDGKIAVMDVNTDEYWLSGEQDSF